MGRSEHKGGFVYGLRCTCHPDAPIRYVGKTIRTIHERMHGHVYHARHNRQWPVSRWMRRHGVENIVAEQIEECPTWDSLNEREIFHIDSLGTFVSEGGLNLTKGGDGSLGTSPTLEQRMAHSRRMRGFRHAPHVYAKIAEKNRGRRCTPEQKAKMSQSAKARVRTDAEMERIRELGDVKLTPKQREEVCHLLLTTNAKIKDIAEMYGVTGGAISNYARKIGMSSFEARSRGVSGDNNPRTRVTKEIHDEILALKGGAEDGVSISRRYGIGSTTVYRIWSGNHHHSR